MMRTHLVPAALLAALLLSGCGAADGGAGAGGGPEADPPIDQPDGGADGPVEETTVDLEAARSDARSLLGQPEDEALEQGDDVRLGRHGDQERPLTFDLQPGRKTIATEDDGTGTYRVVEVVLETPDGQETFTE